MHTILPTFGRPVETNTRAPIFSILVPRAVQKRQQDGIDLTVVPDVVHVGINLIAQAEIQRELRMNPPIVLEIAGNVIIVGIGNDEVLVGRAAANGDREQ